MRCQFDDCQKEYSKRRVIVDKETMQDIFICEECYDQLNKGEKKWKKLKEQ